MSCILNYEALASSIFTGWTDASIFIENTQDEESEQFFRPEYLVTVMIASSILKYNIISTKISQYAMFLEDDTSMGFTRRHDEVIQYDNVGLPKMLRTNSDSGNRVGKFDISIFKKEYVGTIDSYRTYSVIEVKFLYNNYNGIRDDLMRIRELYNIEYSNNSFKYGIVTFSLKPARKDWERLFIGEEECIEKYRSRIIKNLGLKDHNKLMQSIVFCRKSDFDCQQLKYLYIIYCCLA